jgi:hypothetical protein
MSKDMEKYWRNTGRTEEDILRVLEENEWSVAQASRALGYTRPVYLWNRIENNERLMEIMEKHPQEKTPRVFAQVSDEQFIEAIYKARGVKSIIAKLLGLNVSGVYTRINRNPDLQEAVRIASEGFKDIAETKLFELVEAGDFHAIKFYLSTQGRDRGYGDKVEISASMSVEHNWNLNILDVQDLLVLESVARKALPSGEKNDVVDGRFTETTTDSSSD